MGIAKEILEVVEEDVNMILETVQWDPRGCSPEETMALIEVKSSFIRIKESIDYKIKKL